MNTLTKNNYDTLEQIIYQENIRIETVDIHPALDLMLILLNTGRVLSEKLSAYPLLTSATTEQLQKYTLIGEGTGIHWTELDEDLSLKGFLKNSLKEMVVSKAKIA